MFETLFSLGTTAVNTLSNFANWAFTEGFTVLDSTYTPMSVMLGAGLIAYAAYTIALYLIP